MCIGALSEHLIGHRHCRTTQGGGLLRLLARAPSANRSGLLILDAVITGPHRTKGAVINTCKRPKSFACVYRKPHPAIISVLAGPSHSLATLDLIMAKSGHLQFERDNSGRDRFFDWLHRRRAVPALRIGHR